MAASCSFCSLARAPPLRRSVARSAVRCRSAAPGAGGAASTSKLVLEVKERLAREHPGLPTGRNGRDDEDMILWFLKDREFSVDEAVSKLTKAIKWRQDFCVSELSEETVKGLYQTGKAYVHDSLDIYGRPVLVVVAAKHFPSTQDPVGNEKLCAYLVEKALNRLPSGAENILGIFDLRGFRVENGDLQFLKFLIDVFYYYYPKRLGQVLFVDAPFIFQPMWQVVKPLLKSYASLVRFCDSETEKRVLHRRNWASWFPQLGAMIISQLQIVIQERLLADFGGRNIVGGCSFRPSISLSCSFFTVQNGI